MKPQFQLSEREGELFSRYGLDAFEVGVLAVARQFLHSLSDPKSQSWQHGFSIAIERWGEEIGLSVAHRVFKLLRAVSQCRPEGLSFCDPLSLDQRDTLTSDELSLLQMVHHMRRDNTSEAREALDRLTHGRRDPYVIQSGLALANRVPAGMGRPARPARTPTLCVVS